jgi:5-methylcytosine-specific restriction enzyme A
MPWPKGVPRSEETKARMRLAHAGRPGRPQTEETKAKIRAARAAREAAKPPKPPRVPGRKSGWKWTDEQRAAFSAVRANVKVSPEGRLGMSKARTEQWRSMTPEQRTDRIERWQLRRANEVDPRRPRAKRPSGPCQSCGTIRRSLHRDHIVPRWKGGTDDPENIQWLCANCHEDKTRYDLVGRPGPNKGRKHSEETRTKMRNSALRRVAEGYIDRIAVEQPAEAEVGA